MNRIKLANILYIIGIVLIFILCLTKTWLLILLTIIYLGLSVFIRSLEERKIINHVSEFIKEKKFTDSIEYLLKTKDKVYFNQSYYTCLINLCVIYMFNDEAIKAKELLERNPKLKDSKDLYYTQFILAVAEEKEDLIKYFAERINSIKSDVYNVQKESVKKILKMINTKTYDDEIFNNTKYPLLMKICLKYLDENTKVDDLTLEIDNPVVIKPKNLELPKKLKTIKVILIIMCIIGLYLGLFLVAKSVEIKGDLNLIESSYYMLTNMWRFLLPIPIPALCLGYGLYLNKKGYKGKVNLVLGIIFVCIHLLYGLAFSSFNNMYSTESKYLTDLEEKINIDLPDEFTIVSRSYGVTTQTNSQSIFIKSESSVNFNSELENIDLTKWSKGFNNMKNIPVMFVTETSDYDYFLCYCVETNEYNPVDNYINNNYVVMGYNEETLNLIIYEYKVLE